jgi:hypothetical protein
LFGGYFLEIDKRVGGKTLKKRVGLSIFVSYGPCSWFERNKHGENTKKRKTEDLARGEVM